MEAWRSRYANVRVYANGVQYVALLRGINLGAHNKVSMAYLRDLFASLGGEDVSTYVQSGNVVFKSSAAPSKVAEAVEERLKLDLGLEVPVIMRSRVQLAKLLTANPFAAAESEPTKLHVTFLAGRPHRAGARALNALDHGADRFHIVGREIFAHLPNGYAGTKLTNALFEKHLRVAATSRNWRTVTKLAELASASGI